MTDRPYTDADLRHEAAICLLALSTTPGAADIRRWLTGAYVESRRNDDRSGPTWDDLLTEDELDEVSSKVHALVENAARLAEWAVHLGADGLEPLPEQLSAQTDNGPWFRLHFAVRPDMSDDMRRALVEGVGREIAKFF
ncbi:hypothetical protein [Streptomyces luteocolor]|uniref:hypothetical protein n=1 Tax=Streptomyces luteocolor TaxID=285500 RepID=UPI0008530045|nr:hypothetical protein [Streptomyces luteocolor]